MSTHTCDALVVCCIDFRFQKFIQKWLSTHMKKKTYDLVGFAGSTKSLPTIMKQVKISKSLHHITQVVLIHHEECGAYGAESTPKRHAEDLNKAKKRVLRLYPDLQVDLYYLHLDGEFERVSTS
ncbi:hypothetical protein KBB12_02910 [Candidatus Woesebacteria bacterium]|nr:hypothetical protein [Candidatus Woesebacteria bacterium]